MMCEYDDFLEFSKRLENINISCDNGRQMWGDRLYWTERGINSIGFKTDQYYTKDSVISPSYVELKGVNMSREGYINISREVYIKRIRENPKWMEIFIGLDVLIGETGAVEFCVPEKAYTENGTLFFHMV